jgi:hypothetical protein
MISFPIADKACAVVLRPAFGCTGELAPPVTRWPAWVEAVFWGGDQSGGKPLKNSFNYCDTLSLESPSKVFVQRY